MRSRAIIFTLTIFLIAASTGLLIYRANTRSISIQDVIEKAQRLAPNAAIEDMETAEWLVRPERAISIDFNGEKIYVYEYKDPETAERGISLLTEGSPGKSFIVDNSDNLAAKYMGEDERVFWLLGKLFD